MFKNRFIVLAAVLFLVPLCLLPVVTHRLIARERDFGRETGTAYLRANAETWAERLAQGVPLPADAVGGAPQVVVAEVDATGRTVDAQRPFPADGRCFGEAVVTVGGVTRRVRATWPGPVGRGQAHRHSLNALERWVAAVFVVLLVLGFVVLGRKLVRTQEEARRHAAFMADVSHRLKTPLTSISLCAELMDAGRLDAARQGESIRTVVAESAKLGAIVDEFLSYVKGLRHG